jgi:hypothetical protein
MTEHAQAPGGHPPAEPDRIHTWGIVRVGVVSLLIFAGAAASAVLYMRDAQAQLNPAFPVMPAEGGQRKIGIVEQQLFDGANHAQVQQARKQQLLRSYGWVDRKAGLVHLPIDEAMELSLRGERP